MSTPLAALEVLGQVRLFGMSAENIGDGVLIVNRDHIATLTSRGWTVRTDEGATVATLPGYWDAEAVAAAVVCVVMLGARTVGEGSDVDGPDGPSTSGATTVAEECAA